MSKFGLVAAAVVALPLWSASVTYAAASGEEAFLSRLAGEWRGRGTAKFPGRKEAERVTCRIENRWDAGSKTLAVSGECASSQGKSPVKGELRVEQGAIAGAFLGDLDGSAPTKSSGAIVSGRLVVTTSLVDNRTGALSQIRQVIRTRSGGFSAEFFLFDNRNQQFEKSGGMEFSGS